MKRFQVTVNGNSYEVEVEELAAGQVAAPAAPAAPVAPTPAATPAPAAAPAANIPAGANKVTAPMPGKIVNINVTNGQAVEEGDLVCTLEAMKMENEVFASASGTIASINVNPGDAVETGDVIVTIN
ncbi:MAG: biotin/lipoyl-binding protein [Epulopiscium sp.]|nr:biotin/lipoyl-binding protein [Candidatus Epulonipiscium sp.]